MDRRRNGTRPLANIAPNAVPSPLYLSLFFLFCCRAEESSPTHNNALCSPLSTNRCASASVAWCTAQGNVPPLDTARELQRQSLHALLNSTAQPNWEDMWLQSGIPPSTAQPALKTHGHDSVHDTVKLCNDAAIHNSIHP